MSYSNWKKENKREKTKKLIFLTAKRSVLGLLIKVD